MRATKTQNLLKPKTINPLLVKDADQMVKTNLDTIVWQNAIKPANISATESKNFFMKLVFSILYNIKYNKLNRYSALT